MTRTKQTPASSASPVDRAERDEERRVDEQVGLGVEVAAEGGDAARGPGELAVGVVEQRLQLQEDRREQELAAAELDRGEQADARAGDDDGRRRHPERQEREHEQVGERAEDELGGELEGGSLLARCREDRPSRGIGRHRARRRAPQNGDWPRLGDQRVERAEVELARRGAAERHDRAGGDQVVEDQQLHDGERVGAVEVGADRELAEALLAQVAGEVHLLPDRLLDRVRALVRDLPGHVELHGPGPLGQDDPVVVRLADDAGQVGVGQRVAEGELAVEVLLVLVGRPAGRRRRCRRGGAAAGCSAPSRARAGRAR